MKKKLYTLLGICFLAVPAAMAQAPTKAALQAAPPAVQVSPAVSEEETAEETLSPGIELKYKPKLSYSLNMGASFSNWGNATFVQPRLNYQISDRFRFYTSVTALNINSPFSGYAESQNRFGTQHYILEVGGDYLVNDRLIVSGSAWRDFSQQIVQQDGQFLNQRPIQGVDARVHYKITDHFSVSGQVRYSSGPGYPGSLHSPYTPFYRY